MAGMPWPVYVVVCFVECDFGAHTKHNNLQPLLSLKFLLSDGALRKEGWAFSKEILTDSCECCSAQNSKTGTFLSGSKLSSPHIVIPRKWKGRKKGSRRYLEAETSSFLVVSCLELTHKQTLGCEAGCTLSFLV